MYISRKRGIPRAKVTEATLVLFIVYISNRFGLRNLPPPRTLSARAHRMAGHVSNNRLLVFGCQVRVAGDVESPEVGSRDTMT